MKGEVSETSCPGASALPSLNTVRCLWCHAESCGSFQKSVAEVAGGSGVAGQGRAASPSPAAPPEPTPAPGHLQLSPAPLGSLRCFLVGCRLAFASRLPGCGCSQGLGPGTGRWHRSWLTPWLGPAHAAVSASGEIQRGLPQHSAPSTYWVSVVYLNIVFFFPAVGYPLLCNGLSSVQHTDPWDTRGGCTWPFLRDVSHPDFICSIPLFLGWPLYSCG